MEEEGDIELFATPEEELQFKKNFVIKSKEEKFLSRKAERASTLRRARNLEGKLKAIESRGFQFMCIIKPERKENGWFYTSNNFPEMDALVLDTSKIDLQSLKALEEAGALISIADYAKKLVEKPTIDKKRPLGKIEKEKRKQVRREVNKNKKNNKKKSKKDETGETDEECEF